MEFQFFFSFRKIYSAKNIELNFLGKEDIFPQQTDLISEAL